MRLYLTNVDHNIDVRIMIVAIEIALGLLKRIEPNPAHDTAIVAYHLKQRLGVRILLDLLVLVGLLVGSFSPPKLRQPKHGNSKASRAHASKLPSSARDPGIGNAPQDGAGGVGVVGVGEGLGCPRVLPVLGDGGGDDR